jgi:hypothetical protein
VKLCLVLTSCAGATYGNTPITLYGSGFANTPDIVCRFSGVADVGARWISPSRVICLSPERLSAGNVSVEFSYNQQDFSNNSIPFRYSSPAISLNLIPSYGPISGGKRISIFGLNFDLVPEFTCMFDIGGDKVVVPGVAFNISYAVCLSPAVDSSALTQSVTLAVSNNGVDFQLSLPYILFDLIQVNGIFPSAGPSIGGTPISIFGSGFATGLQNVKNNLKCSFGQRLAAAQIQSETTLTCTSPASDVGRLNFRVLLDDSKIGDVMILFEYYGELMKRSCICLLRLLPKVFSILSCRTHIAFFFDAVLSNWEPASRSRGFRYLFVHI